MKKMLKIIGFILLTIIVIGFVILKVLGSRPAAPTDYQQTVQTGGNIEKNIWQAVLMKYLHMNMPFYRNLEKLLSIIHRSLKQATKNILLL